MRLTAECEGQTHALKIRHEGSSVVAEIDGRAYQLGLHEPEFGQYLCIENTLVHDCRVEKRPGQTELLVVHLGTDSYEIKLIDPKRLRSAQSSGAHSHGSAEIVAPMPGRVVRVLVEVGQQVAAGEGVAVVEAMKMQNEMKAPRAGTVVALSATAGETVNAGDVLAIVE
jgi:biotin carboxyl carrier protein